MTRAHREHPEAAAEFDSAVLWYEEQEPGIGLRFLDRTEQARQDISEWPSAAPAFMIAEDGTVVRFKAIRGYPYRVIYSVQPDSILILAYAHNHREPGYWRARL